MTLSFRSYIADLLPSLQWRHFGVGALQAYLFEGERLEQRIHVWHPALVRDGIRGNGDCHSHRFSFMSHVLCGAIDNSEVLVTEDPSGPFDLYEVEHARAAFGRAKTFDGDCRVVARCRARQLTPRVVVAGQSYEFERGRYHVSRFLGVTVTLVTKFDQQPIAARIMCPHGAPLVHAFGGPVPDVPGIIAEARTALNQEPGK